MPAVVATATPPTAPQAWASFGLLIVALVSVVCLLGALTATVIMRSTLMERLDGFAVERGLPDQLDRSPAAIRAICEQYIDAVAAVL